MTHPPVSPRPDAIHWKSPLWLLAALLASLATLGPFAIDAYLPAFEGITRDLATGPVQMQQTLSGYLLGFSVMMLFHGALSDSFGRRRIVFGGLLAFALASAVCASSTHIGTLIAGRVIQGMSCGAGMVVGRAIVRDLFSASDAQRLMSQITLFFGIAPAVAPIVGGWVFTLIGWRAIFWLLALIPALLLVLCWKTLPETLAVEQRQPFAPGPLARGYLDILSAPRFFLLTIASGIPFNSTFIFVLTAPTFLGHHLGFSPTQFFWLFLATISGIMGGAWTSGRFAGKIARERQVGIGFAILLAAAALNALWHVFIKPTPLSAILPIAAMSYGWSLLTPCVTLMVMDLFPARLGMASSLQGFLASLSNAVVAGLIAPAVMGSVESLAATSLLFGLIGWVCWKLHGRLARHR